MRPDPLVLAVGSPDCLPKTKSYNRGVLQVSQLHLIGFPFSRCVLLSVSWKEINQARSSAPGVSG